MAELMLYSLIGKLLRDASATARPREIRSDNKNTDDIFHVKSRSHRKDNRELES